MRATIPGPAGALETVLELPPANGDAAPAPCGAALVCHPHPLHGGTMRNTIVVRTARALRATGMATLRMNFRGVEGSEGTHDGHGAEEGDAAAGLDHLQERFPGVPLWAAGYSFGARTVAGLVGKDARIERVILIAFPLAVFDCSFLSSVQQPGLLLFGGDDEFGSVAELERQFPDLSARFEVDEIEGGGHFFRGRTPLVEERVRAYATAAWETSR